MRVAPSDRMVKLTSRTMLPLLGVVLGCALQAAAQGHGGGGPGGGGPGGGFGGGGMPHGPFGSNPGFPNARNAPGSSANGSNPDGAMHGGLQLGPAGRWWDDHQFARSIGIDSAQQQRMDDVFGANKSTLVKLYKNLQHEESQLGKVTRARELNEVQIFDQIDRVVQARGELEKASAHYLLQIRKEMTPEQVARLDDRRSTP